MRNSFARKLTELASQDKRVILLMGDIGNKMFDEFKNVAKDRFINCGIAEANMMSMAAGLALNGLRPFVYTITPFVTLRCLEQIRTSVAYHEAKVVIVGTGSGVSYAELGPTHHSLDDIGILNMIPNLHIFTPCDPNEVEESMEDALKINYPSYIRLGKKGEPILQSINDEANKSTARIIHKGEDSIIIGYGPILEEALKAAAILKDEKININVASIRKIFPFDESFFNALIKKNITNWYILEEHYQRGGLFSLLLHWLYENKLINFINLKSLSFNHEFIHNIGKQNYIRMNYNLDSYSIAESILTNENRN